jgi:hypothetical protein
MKPLRLASMLALAAAATVWPQRYAPVAVAQTVQSGNTRITMQATPRVLVADGKSKSRMLIEVRDRSNTPLPDGTPVICNTDLGLLATTETDKRQTITATIRGGFATVYASSPSPGTAHVVARVRDSSNEVVLQYLPEGTQVQAAPRVVTVTGGWVGYSPEADLIKARDGARAVVGPLTIDAANGLEIGLSGQCLRAWGVTITARGAKLSGEDAYLDLAAGQGVLRRFGDLGLERVAFSLSALDASPADDAATPDGAFRPAEDESLAWMVCASCLLYPNEKIVLRKAVLYAGESRVARLLPIWVIALPGYSGVSNSQVVGLSSGGGLAVNLPLFYHVSDEWAGSVRVQRGVAGSSFSARHGWTLGVGEEYGSAHARGAIEVEGMLAGDWGAEWHDERASASGDQAAFSISSPDHRSLFGDASWYRYEDPYRLNIRAQYDHGWGSSSVLTTGVGLMTEPRALSGDVDYRLGVSASTTRSAGEEHPWVFDNEFYAGLDLTTWRPTKGTRVTPSVSEVYAWNTANFHANSARAQVRISQELGRQASLGLTYYLTHRAGDTEPVGFSHMLGVDATASRPGRWTGSLAGTWDVTRGDTYGQLQLDRFLTAGWRAGLSASHYDFDSTAYSDVEVEVGRPIGGRDVALRYSFRAGRLSLEVGSVVLGN